MTRVYIKICGMMTQQDVAICSDLGIQAVGLVIDYPVPVPWNLTRDQGKDLRARLDSSLSSVVVCSGEPHFLEGLARDVRPDALQVHGDETLVQTAEVVQRLQPLGVKVYRALRICPDTGEAAGEIPGVAAAARAIEATGAAGLVVDSKVPHRPGGTGIAVDVESLRQVAQAVRIPVIAAGGLNAQSVAAVIRAVRPFGVDVLSGIEERPGVKSREKMTAFVAAVNNA